MFHVEQIGDILMDLDKLIQFKGIGTVTFGQTKSEVTKIMGDDYLEEPDDDDLSIIYEDKGLEFTFWDDEDGRLGLIESARSSLVFCGKKLYGLTKDAVRKFINEDLGTEVTIDDSVQLEDGSLEAWLEVHDSEVIFWFTDGSLSSVTIGCQWVDDDKPSWPDKTTD